MTDATDSQDDAVVTVSGDGSDYPTYPVCPLDDPLKRDYIISQVCLHYMEGMEVNTIAQIFSITPDEVVSLISDNYSRRKVWALEEKRALENDRLDYAQRALAPLVTEGDLKAIHEWINLSSRRAALNGLDAPRQVSMKVSVAQEIDNALESLEAILLQEDTQDKVFKVLPEIEEGVTVETVDDGQNNQDQEQNNEVDE